MGKKIVIALGGNALGETPSEQKTAIRKAVAAIADLVEDGNEVLVTHGNGPQVGMISQRFREVDMATCVAMSQAYIGFDMQNILQEEFCRRNINKLAVTILTQMVVDPGDPAFQNPTKPIGAFLTQEDARRITVEEGCAVMEDAGRGWRRAVASPKPITIVEIEAIKILFNTRQIVIAVGGGGIPVVKVRDCALEGIHAVIDKDLAAAQLAAQLGADQLVMVTTVEKVAIRFGQPDQDWLSRISLQEAKRYLAEGHFAAGSMQPKMEAAIGFVQEMAGRLALITNLESLRDGIRGNAGTMIA